MQKNKDLFAQHVGEYLKGILKNAWRTGHETFKNKQPAVENKPSNLNIG